MAASEIKIKFREEGPVVNAYIEIPSSPPETLHVAMVRKTLLEAHPSLFDSFNAFGVEIARVIIESIGGQISTVTTEQAPEHERAGHG